VAGRAPEHGAGEVQRSRLVRSRGLAVQHGVLRAGRNRAGPVGRDVFGVRMAVDNRVSP
jgi:hypothetical protein